MVNLTQNIGGFIPSVHANTKEAYDLTIYNLQ